MLETIFQGLVNTPSWLFNDINVDNDKRNRKNEIQYGGGCFRFGIRHQLELSLPVLTSLKRLIPENGTAGIFLLDVVARSRDSSTLDGSNENTGKAGLFF